MESPILPTNDLADIRLTSAPTPTGILGKLLSAGPTTNAPSLLRPCPGMESPNVPLTNPATVAPVPTVLPNRPTADADPPRLASTEPPVSSEGGDVGALLAVAGGFAVLFALFLLAGSRRRAQRGDAVDLRASAGKGVPRENMQSGKKIGVIDPCALDSSGNSSSPAQCQISGINAFTLDSRGDYSSCYSSTFLKKNPSSGISSSVKEMNDSCKEPMPQYRQERLPKQVSKEDPMTQPQADTSANVFVDGGSVADVAAVALIASDSPLSEQRVSDFSNSSSASLFEDGSAPSDLSFETNDTDTDEPPRKRSMVATMSAAILATGNPNSAAAAAAAAALFTSDSSFTNEDLDTTSNSSRAASADWSSEHGFPLSDASLDNIDTDDKKQARQDGLVLTGAAARANQLPTTAKRVFDLLERQQKSDASGTGGQIIEGKQPSAAAATEIDDNEKRSPDMQAAASNGIQSSSASGTSKITGGQKVWSGMEAAVNAAILAASNPTSAAATAALFALDLSFTKEDLETSSNSSSAASAEWSAENEFLSHRQKRAVCEYEAE